MHPDLSNFNVDCSVENLRKIINVTLREPASYAEHLKLRKEFSRILANLQLTEEMQQLLETQFPAILEDVQEAKINMYIDSVYSSLQEIHEKLSEKLTYTEQERQQLLYQISEAKECCELTRGNKKITRVYLVCESIERIIAPRIKN